ncbi:MAG: hypothetical protein C5B59_18940 [Bacteroidetes bacterium]|nr:MAG: hypothetical protein C5B59_18940 [Bacteroidota bacterium]
MLILILVLCGSVYVAKGQHPEPVHPVQGYKKPMSNLHQKRIPVSGTTISFDSLSILPKTFSVIGIPDSLYHIDYVNATLEWKRKPNIDSVLVVYRTFPYKLNSVTKRMDYEKIENNFIIKPEVYYGPGQGSDNFFNFGNITYNGSFGRAIAFGNSQDAVVTSNLNLQLNGYLADSIEIAAAITDNNIPIQPDGTTAEINDFDRIFLQFKKRNWALSMGDIDLRQNQNYFLNFYKRLRGASFETTTPIGKNSTNKLLLSGAVAKGKFTRNVFQGLEGNQGPYRLTGANNELYFIVLAGTEKVYIDGQLMQRGEDQDYIINYNTAEITFTQKRMVTKDSRIQVEFEYSNQYFLNFNLYLADEVNVNNKLKLRFGLFSNSDSRNSPINQTLDPNQRRFLNQLGDSVDKAFYPTAPLDTFGTGKILYQKMDTVFIDGEGFYRHDSIYVFSVNSKVNLYNLSFTNVGVGNGNYIPDLNGSNGNVYKWVAPVNGVKQGQFEAAQFLVTPKTQQVVTVGADYAINRNTTVSGDFAKSHYDVNTLSTKDKANDNGYATKWVLRNRMPFQSAKGLALNTNFSYEYVDARFQPLERLRPVEFLRDWGLPLTLPQDNESLFGASFQLIDRKKNSVKYEISGYDRGSSFKGIRNTFSHFTEIGGWRFNDQISLTNGNGISGKGYFLRPTVDISKQLKSLGNYIVGGGYSLEHNENHSRITDSVLSTSYAFQVWQAYLKSPEKNPNHWGINYFARENSYPFGKQLAKSDRSQNINLFIELLKNRHQQFRFNATYRNLQVINSNITNQQADKSLLGRVEYIVNGWKGLLMGNALYEVGSGQEQKRAFSYVEVPAGTGQYAWIDLNNDGIQQLNEFVIAQFPDQAKFIRVFTPTNQFVKANYNTFNYSISINPRAVISPKSKGLKRILANSFLQSSLQLNQKQQANSFVQLNPFKAPLDDSSLITRTAIFVNSFSFNKSNPRWGFDISNNRNSNKTLLTYGYQTQALNEWNVRTRLSLSRSFLLNALFKTATNQLLTTSTNFDNSNYDLSQHAIEPDISYTRKTNLRITIGYKYTDKKNSPKYGGDTYFSNSINSDIKYNILQNTALQAKFTYSDIHYKGNTNSTVSYIILDGLLPGKNYLWNLDFTKKLGPNLELGIQYEGRKPGEGRTVHTGRASLRAIL